MRRDWLIARVAVLSVAATVAPLASTAAASGPLVAPIPVIQIDGRGFGHGVGMAQDGALAMGRAGATTKQILGQFYPGTTVGKTAGSVRVPVLTGNPVELSFPDGGELRGQPAQNSPPFGLPLKVGRGGTALVYREGDGTRVRTMTPSSSPSTTSSSTSSSTTSTTTRPSATTTTTTLIPLGPAAARPNQAVGVSPTTTSTSSTTSTTVGDQQAVALFSGVVTAASSGDGRIGVTPRNHRYRGVIEIAPVAPNTLRFVNQVPVETYLRGMGEVRNPSWPAASLQTQAIAARTYAMRAMGAGGELCDSQRCQVYLGADAEYAAMDKAVSATAGQVLRFGTGLASAVYSANGGGHSASREEGFGQTGPSYPYLRAAPYPTNDLAAWSVVIALRDVASRLNYRGEITSVEVTARGESERATRVTLRGSGGELTVTGLAFDAALGLRSTLFSLRVTTATSVPTLTGGSVLQAPPEEAAAIADAHESVAPTLKPKALAPPLSVVRSHGVGAAGPFAAVLWAGVTVAAVTTRRRSRDAWHAMLS